MVVVSVAGREISLPKVCDLYMLDFGNKSLECLRSIQPLMNSAKRNSIREVYQWSGKAPKIKTSTLSWECRTGFAELAVGDVFVDRGMLSLRDGKRRYL